MGCTASSAVRADRRAAAALQPALGVLDDVYQVPVEQIGYTDGHLVIQPLDRDLATLQQASLLYGELLPLGVLRLLDAKHARAGDASVLYDLGMGTGKALLQAFLLYTNIQRGVGCELSPSRFAVAEEAVLALEQVFPGHFEVTARIPGKFIRLVARGKAAGASGRKAALKYGAAASQRLGQGAGRGTPPPLSPLPVETPNPAHPAAAAAARPLSTTAVDGDWCEYDDDDDDEEGYIDSHDEEVEEEGESRPGASSGHRSPRSAGAAPPFHPSRRGSTCVLVPATALPVVSTYGQHLGVIAAWSAASGAAAGAPGKGSSCHEWGGNDFGDDGCSGARGAGGRSRGGVTGLTNPKRGGVVKQGSKAPTASSRAASSVAPPGCRVLELHCCNVWTVRDVAAADVVILHVEVPRTPAATAACRRTILGLKRGARFVTYHDVRHMWGPEGGDSGSSENKGWSDAPLPFAQVPANVDEDDVFLTSWSAQRGHHLYVWEKTCPAVPLEPSSGADSASMREDRKEAVH